MRVQEVFQLVCELCNNIECFISRLESIISEENCEIKSELTDFKNKMISGKEILDGDLNEFKIIITDYNIFVDDYVYELRRLMKKIDKVKNSNIYDKLDELAVDIYNELTNLRDELDMDTL